MAAVAHQRNGRALPQPSGQDFFQDCFFFLAGPLATAAMETAKRARAPAVEAYLLDTASHRAQRAASPSQIAHMCRYGRFGGVRAVVFWVGWPCPGGGGFRIVEGGLDVSQFRVLQKALLEHLGSKNP
jgi:hypothetical protein